MYEPTINLLEVPEYTYSLVDIFIWENKYKEPKRKEMTFKENKKDVQPATPALYPKT